MSGMQKRAANARVGSGMAGRRHGSLMTAIALLFLSVTPLVVRYVAVDFVAPDITNTTSADTDTIYDMFTYVKMQLIYVFVIIIAVIFCKKLLGARLSEQTGHFSPHGFRLTRYDAALACLCLALMLSCLTSEYSVIALNGFALMQDGTLEHICYCALFFFGFHVFSRCEFKRLFFVPLYVVGIVNALMSFANFSGTRLIDSRIARAVIGIPRDAQTVAPQALTSTFGNINYLSGFGGVLFSIFLARLMFSKSPRRDGAVDRRALAANVGSALMVAVSFSIIVTSLSSSGFLTFAVMTPVIFAIAAASGFTKRKLVLAAASLVICAAVFAPLAALNKAVLDETLGMLRSLPVFSARARDASDGMPALVATVPVAAPGSTNGAASVATVPVAAPGTTASGAPALAAARSAAAPDHKAILASAAPDHKVIRLTSAAVDHESICPAVGVPAQATDHKAIRLAAGISAHATNMQFAAVSASRLSRSEPGLSPQLPQEFPAPGIAPGSGRLYIWKDTLGLIARRPLLGYGMDTLSYAFPQNDIAKIAGIGSYSVFVTKPHNVYIGYAYGAGIPAALAFLALCAFGAIEFFRYIFLARAGRAPHDPLIICALIGWAAYMTQALVNDDLIATAPLWWTLFGLGTGSIRALQSGAASGTAKEQAHSR